MPEIIVIAHNIRSTHNIGSIFRTCEGFGVSKLIISGYSPYPKLANETRLPHIYNKLTDQIHKSALGAELLVDFDYIDTPNIELFKSEGYEIVALEQADNSIDLHDYKPTSKIVLLLGEEVNGITKELIEKCDTIVEIPMVGKKESFNVSVATGIALYQMSI